MSDLSAKERAIRLVYADAIPQGGIPIDEFKRHLEDSKRNQDAFTQSVWKNHRELVASVTDAIKEAEQAAEARMREPLKECSHFVANRPSQCPECGSRVFISDMNSDRVLRACCENHDCSWVGCPCYTCLFITKAKAEEMERIEQVIRNYCVAITAETLVRVIRRRSGE
ncbi:hypothetical protein LCGC14_2983860 [marine sediment metagenome]|uniref:Uncharacterized protein n=1 Tax=marine sediment metagenome TaxID=412755 RepID=A0A0F8X5U3_9ZZZZ